MMAAFVSFVCFRLVTCPSVSNSPVVILVNLDYGLFSYTCCRFLPFFVEIYPYFESLLSLCMGLQTWWSSGYKVTDCYYVVLCTQEFKTHPCWRCKIVFEYLFICLCFHLCVKVNKTSSLIIDERRKRMPPLIGWHNNLGVVWPRIYSYSWPISHSVLV